MPGIGPLVGGQTDAPTVALVERSVRPEAIAFGVFGIIAALAALLICGQVISRLVRRNADDGGVLRALGAGPLMTTADGLLGVLGAVVLGALLAVVVAIGLSPLAPIGAVRPIYPDLGIAFDWTIFGIGFAVLVVVLSAVSVLMAIRGSPHRAASRGGPRSERGSSLARGVTAIGLPLAAVTGIRSALGLGTRRAMPAPVYSAMFGAVLAVVVVVTSFTFGASLKALVSHPPLYGWNCELRAVVGFLRSRGPARRADSHIARSRPGRRPLGRGLFRGRKARRPACARPRRPSECRRGGHAADRTRCAVSGPGGTRVGHAG